MKDLIFSILRPFLEAYAMLRYKSIWGLKARLQKRPGKLSAFSNISVATGRVSS